MTRRQAGAIAAGGAAGATLRWALVSISPSDGGVRWVVMAINVAGSALLGVLLAEEWSRPRLRRWVHDFGAIGFCGGLTTFSTFSLEIVELLHERSANAAALHAVLSVSLSVVALVAGAAAMRRTRAAGSPLEEVP